MSALGLLSDIRGEYGDAIQANAQLYNDLKNKQTQEAINDENIFRPLNTVDDVIFYMKKYPSKNLGACFDSGHANIMENGRNIPGCIANKAFGDCGFEVPWEHDGYVVPSAQAVAA